MTIIYVKQTTDEQWKYGKNLESSQIILWTKNSWPTKPECTHAAELEFPSDDLRFQEETE
jgi:hypothetical protein